MRDQVDGCGPGPVEVFEHDCEWPRACKLLQGPLNGAEEPKARRTIVAERRLRLFVEQLFNEFAPFVAAANGITRSAHRRRAQGFNDRFVRPPFAPGSGLADDGHAALAFDEARDFGNEPALADPGLARNEECSRPAVGAGVPAI